MRLHLTLLSLLLIAGCTPTEPVEEASTTEADVEAINNVVDQHVSAINSGDAAAEASLYTNDAIKMPTNQPVVTGNEAIRSWTQNMIDQFTLKLAVSSDELKVAGDWAFLRSIYTQSMTPKAGGEPTEDNGKYLVIFERQPDGCWKAARDIWNSDNPAPGQ